MNAVIIYYDKEKTCFQVIRPSNKFAGDWEGLVQTVTKTTDHRQGYWHYEII